MIRAIIVAGFGGQANEAKTRIVGGISLKPTSGRAASASLTFHSTGLCPRRSTDTAVPGARVSGLATSSTTFQLVGA